MSLLQPLSLSQAASTIAPDQPVLIAGPTASGKSALALQIATTQGGTIINADASQVYDCWQVITARPPNSETDLAPHQLYGHISAKQSYSTGHWLREVLPLLKGTLRPIIVGGTGLYFSALTEGLAEIPVTPKDIRARGDALSLEDLRAGVDALTLGRIDTANRARVQRAWEVVQTTGKPLALWQDETPPPALPLEKCAAFVMDCDKDWLNDRIERRFDLMLGDGALDEIAAVAPEYDPTCPAHRAIGVPELMAHFNGDIPLEAARDAAVIATRQFAKRQRTWFRSRMKAWQPLSPHA